MNNHELDSVEDAENEPSFDYGAKKRRIVVWLLSYSAILGIITCFLPEEGSPSDFIIGLPLLVLGISWCFTDAAERDHEIGQLTRLLLIFVFVVGLPIYFFQTRGIGALKTLALTLLLIGAMVVCAFVTIFATVHVGEAMGLWDFAF